MACRGAVASLPLLLPRSFLEWQPALASEAENNCGIPVCVCVCVGCYIAAVERQGGKAAEGLLPLLLCIMATISIMRPHPSAVPAAAAARGICANHRSNSYSYKRGRLFCRDEEDPPPPHYFGTVAATAGDGGKSFVSQRKTFL